MAAFLARSAGRVAVDDFVSVPLSTTDTTLATVSIKAGDVTGGYANILVEGTASAVNGSLASCPCGTVFFLADPGQPDRLAGVLAPGRRERIRERRRLGRPERGGHRPHGRRTDVRPSGLRDARNGRGDDGVGTLTATYIPFVGDGTNALVPVSAEIDVDPVAQPRD